MRLTFKFSINISRDRPAPAPEPEQRDTALDALVERRDSDGPPELHADYREEPMYRAGQTIGFSRRRHAGRNV
jgi:hypothetical protein